MYIGKPLSYLDKSKSYKLFGNWHKSWGCPAFADWAKNPQYSINVSNDDILHISLLQQDWKIFTRNTQKPYYHIGFSIFLVEENRDIRIHRISELIGISNFVNKRESSLHIRVFKGRYVIIPSIYQADLKIKDVSFLFRIWTENSACSFKPLSREAPKVSFFSSKPNGVLTVEIVKAKDLTPVGVISCDPFAEVNIEGTTKRTRTGLDPTHPIWNQQFIFFIKKPNKCKLKITIWHDAVLLSTFMGTATMEISELINKINGATYRCSLPLKPRAKDEKQGKEVSGFVVVRLNYFGNVNSC